MRSNSRWILSRRVTAGGLWSEPISGQPTKQILPITQKEILLIKVTDWYPDYQLPSRPLLSPELYSVMPQLVQLLSDVAVARIRFIDEVEKLTEAQAHWKPLPDEWSATEITEHLYWAEHGGIWGMWRALDAQKAGNPIWQGELIHKGLPIETIIERTWQTKEIVPPMAAPRMGGPVAFWLSAFTSLQQPLHDLGNALTNADLEKIIHPHPISGPLDIRQRFEFLRFHIDRHRKQVMELGLI